MQTTLLGLAIALILALVSALVAPLVVDWNHYRGAVEREAGRLTGLGVHVNGAIDARLLPSPIITLHDVQVGGTGQEPQMRAATIELELALGPLLRGEVQASKVHLIGPQISLGLDRSGTIDWPTPSASFRPDALSVAHVNIEEGHVTLTDAVSGSRLVLRKFWFDGDVHSFAGPFNGQGAAVVGDELYGYRVSGSPAASGAGTKIRLSVDPSNHPLTTDFDGTLTFVQGVPQFDGTMVLARPVGATLANGKRVVNAPWRAAGALRASPTSLSVQRVAFRYGSEERGLNFTVNGELTLGDKPNLKADVSALQLDIDRALADPDMTNRPPLTMVRSFLQAFVTAAKLPLSAQIAFSVDALAVNGTTLESLHGEVDYDRTGWSLDKFHFRAPGMTEVNLSGQLMPTPAGFAFKGPGSLQSGDADLLMAWIKGRGASPTGGAKPLSAHGEVTIASDSMAVAQLSAMLGQENIEGELSYTLPSAGHPARLVAALRAAKLDLDALTAFARASIGADGLALPGEGTLALDIGTARFGGVDAQAVNAQLKFDAGELQIDRLSIGDVGGAKLAINGRIDDLSSQPRGQLTLDLDARALDGVGDLLAKFAPRAADALRHGAARLAPAKIHGVLTVERAATTGSIAELKIDGTLAAMRVAIDANASGEPAHLGNATVKLTGKIDADDGSALVALLGLDRFLAVDQLPGQFTLNASGPLNGDIHVDGEVSASGFDTTIAGVLRLIGDDAPTATFQVSASAGDLRPLQKTLTGQAGDAAGLSVRAALAVDGDGFSFTDIAATIGKATVKGHLGLDLTSPVGIDGELDADNVDGAVVTAMLLGLPSAQDGGKPWSSSPIGDGAFSGLSGVLAFKLGHAVFTPALIATGLNGNLKLQPSQVTLDGLDGQFAGGRLTGALSFHRDQNGLAAHGEIDLAGAAAPAILGSALNLSGGTLTLSLQADGLGASPIGFIGSLHGSGTLSLKDVLFAGLDSGAFDAAIGAAGAAGTIDLAKVQAAATAKLTNGRLSVPQGAVAVTIATGLLNVNHVRLPAQGGTELALDGAVDLTSATIDGRMTLSEAAPANALIRTRPEVSVAVKGPLFSPARTVDLSTLTSWLTLNAAELQTRLIESIEANQRVDGAGAVNHLTSPGIRAVPPGIVVDVPAPNASAAAGTEGLERLQPQAPPLVPDQSHPGSGSIDPGAAAANVPTPIPAPRTIRPPGDPAEQDARRAAPPAPAKRSIFDFLFGSHH